MLMNVADWLRWKNNAKSKPYEERKIADAKNCGFNPLVQSLQVAGSSKIHIEACVNEKAK